MLFHKKDLGLQEKTIQLITTNSKTYHNNKTV